MKFFLIVIFSAVWFSGGTEEVTTGAATKLVAEWEKVPKNISSTAPTFSSSEDEEESMNWNDHFYDDTFFYKRLETGINLKICLNCHRK